jgi:MFS family permease
MSSPHSLTHRRSTSGLKDDWEESASLELSRARSQEFSAVESIAVQDIDPNNNTLSQPEVASWPRSVRYLVFLCAFLTSLSFGVTQVPLLYIVRLMTCDDYYKDNAPKASLSYAFSLFTKATQLFHYNGYEIDIPAQLGAVSITKDRCSNHAIESSTALFVAVLGATTTVFGLINLFVTGGLIKKIGVKPTLTINVFVPAVRLFIQNIGVEVWGKAGIYVIQCSQIITIFGGPSGYVLCLNTFITDVVEFEGRTAALGRLTGAMLAGSALGFLSGGLVAEAFGIKAPFRLTLLLFLIATLYVAIFLPHIPPAVAEECNGETPRDGKKWKSVRNFFAPLAVFIPKKFIMTDGGIQTEYGALLLACGVFLAILATGYLQTLLQLFATDMYGFGTRENGWLIFMYSMLRGLFLTFAFPKLIAIGRRTTKKTREKAPQHIDEEVPESSERQPLLGTQRNNTSSPEHAVNKDQPPKKEEVFTFDLTYTRFSLITDGLLTLLCTFVRAHWQMYLVAAVLPFAAGTGSAAKGTILQMVGSSASSAERTDALAGVSLVENIARLSTVFIFGLVFAGFASIGRTELVFTCNAVSTFYFEPYARLK